MTSTQQPSAQQQTGWVGWIVFAAIMLAIGGTLNAIWGLIAILNDTWTFWGDQGALTFDISTWGWIHLILGVAVFFAGIGLMSGNVLARTVGVIVASLSLIGNFLVLPAYPFWSTIIIVIDVLVIWALMVHGDEMRV
jgi:hypothetical protein